MNKHDILLALGKRIRMTRTQKRMTQSDLALECNFEKARMSRIESGQSNLTIHTLSKISKALDIRLAELLKD